VETFIFINQQRKQEVVSMSIETDLNRIATSLEEIVKVLRNPSKSTPASNPSNAANVETLGGKKGKGGTPQPVSTVVEDPITGQPMPTTQATVAPQPTLDDLHTQLRLLKDSQKPTGGIEACKKIMIEFGADKTRPVISSIPPANYAALIAKIGTLL
jgi:hypothetical protein